MILFGGFTGSGADIMIAAMRAAGAEIFTSTFIGVVVSNFVDKIISCVLVSLVLSKIPARTLGINNRHAQ
jgi:energy-coupling factor transport system substrate-specific component